MQKSGGAVRWWGRWIQHRHHRQAVRALEQRLRSGLVVDSETGCHVWATTRQGGYAQLHVSAHRLAWELVNGPIPKGMHALHRCDNSRCCNPDHLFLGTQADNMADMRRKGRGRIGHSPKPEAARGRPLATTIEPQARPNGH